MNTSKRAFTAITVAFLCVSADGTADGTAGSTEAGQDDGLIVTPTSLILAVGETASLMARVQDDEREAVERPIVFYSRSPRHVSVDAAGVVTAHKPGEHVVMAIVPDSVPDTALNSVSDTAPDAGRDDARGRAPIDGDDEPAGRLRVAITVSIPAPPIGELRIEDLPTRFYAGTSLALSIVLTDTSGAQRDDAPLHFESDAPETAMVDTTGRLSLLGPGRVTIRARAESVVGSATLDVEADPAQSFTLKASANDARTGDVVRFRAIALDDAGNEVPDYPVHYSVSSAPSARILAPGASADIAQDGAFVAERSGVHTVVAIGGPHAATRTIRVEPRNVKQKLVPVGHGAVNDRHTSDLWVWRGVDGDDYAITGTWGTDGRAYIWDVSDPGQMTIIRTIELDARTVNDVKVSADGRTAVLTREGASNRKNGIVVVDVSDPHRAAPILAHYDDQLTGGVHNVFLWNEHVFALSNSRRYDIISLEDPRRPVRVGRFELDVPGHAVHDVWVDDGVAYSSNWHEGILAVDVGGGALGGTLRAPVKIGSYAWPSGWCHAALPHTSPSTGKRYVFGGDEAFPYGMNPEAGSTPERAAGWIHVLDVDDWSEPKEVARYQVPGAGAHNMWIDGEILYVGYYNGGLRAVDISGELRGDLYQQGREIAFFFPDDPQGFIPNAPFVWGAQVHAGHIFLADFNSGLWAVKLVPFALDEARPDLGEPQ